MSLDMYTVIVKKQTNEFEKLDHWKLILYKNTFDYFPVFSLFTTQSSGY